MREVILDLETTGLDEQIHKIIEIGIVEIYNKTPTGNTFHVYLNPERDIDEEAEAIHGISLSFLQNKQKFAEVAQECLDFIGKSPIVAHNISFDMKFFNKELERIRIPKLTNMYIDTLDIARRKFGAVKLNLDALCSRFGISTSNRALHGALKDAELLSQVYYYLSIDYDDIFSLKNDNQNTFVSKINFTARNFDFYLSPEELDAHNKMYITC